MLTLDNLMRTRSAKDLRRDILARITGIPGDRIKDFETGKERLEPWLDEAALLARCLCVGGIINLINTSGSLTDCDIGTHLVSDIAYLRAGSRLPLSMACRLTIKLGLRDPIELIPDRVGLQTWDLVARNERGAGPGECPVCLADTYAGAGHLPTCLGDIVYGARDIGRDTLGPRPRVERYGERRAGGSGTAFGLKDVRLAARLTQKQVADAIGMSQSYIAQMERGETPMRVAKAEALAQVLRIDVAEIYKRAPDTPPPAVPFAHTDAGNS